jgi:hypothetical protein
VRLHSLAITGLATLAFAQAACANASTVPTECSVPQPTEAEAIVVVVYPEATCPHKQKRCTRQPPLPLVMDDRTYIAHVAPGSYAAVAVAVGEHALFTWHRSTLETHVSAMQMDLARGRTYYAEVRAFCWDTSRGGRIRSESCSVELLAMNRWAAPSARSWTRRLQHLVANGNEGQLWAYGSSEVANGIVAGFDYLHALDVESLPDHTLSPKDGLD